MDEWVDGWKDGWMDEWNEGGKDGGREGGIVLVCPHISSVILVFTWSIRTDFLSYHVKTSTCA